MFKLTLFSFITWLVIVIGGGYGWIHNIIVIAHSDFSHLTGMLVLRVIGIFVAPLGMVLGYC